MLCYEPPQPRPRIRRGAQTAALSQPLRKKNDRAREMVNGVNASSVAAGVLARRPKVSRPSKVDCRTSFAAIRAVRCRPESLKKLSQNLARQLFIAQLFTWIKHPGRLR